MAEVGCSIPGGGTASHAMAPSLTGQMRSDATAAGIVPNTSTASIPQERPHISTETVNDTAANLMDNYVPKIAYQRLESYLKRQERSLTYQIAQQGLQTRTNEERANAYFRQLQNERNEHSKTRLALRRAEEHVKLLLALNNAAAIATTEPLSNGSIGGNSIPTSHVPGNVSGLVNSGAAPCGEPSVGFDEATDLFSEQDIKPDVNDLKPEISNSKVTVTVNCGYPGERADDKSLVKRIPCATSSTSSSYTDYMPRAPTMGGIFPGHHGSVAMIGGHLFSRQPFPRDPVSGELIQPLSHHSTPVLPSNGHAMMCAPPAPAVPPPAHTLLPVKFRHPYTRRELPLPNQEQNGVDIPGPSGEPKPRRKTFGPRKPREQKLLQAKEASESLDATSENGQSPGQAVGEKPKRKSRGRLSDEERRERKRLRRLRYKMNNPPRKRTVEQQARLNAYKRKRRKNLTPEQKEELRAQTKAWWQKWYSKLTDEQKAARLVHLREKAKQNKQKKPKGWTRGTRRGRPPIDEDDSRTTPNGDQTDQMEVDDVVSEMNNILRGTRSRPREALSSDQGIESRTSEENEIESASSAVAEIDCTL